LGFDDPLVDPHPDADVFDGRLDAGTDQFEPNDTFDMAMEVGPGAYDLAIFPATDNDFLRISAGGTLALTATITFSNAEGDLDLRFRSQTTMVDIAMSASTTNDSETVSVNLQPPDTYLLLIYAGARGPTVYHLDLQYTVTPPPDAAITDAGP